ncbi:MAG TPA: hypothetical protein VNL77_14575 [Roseiflexaceae bacterium]|nr:hypothetical protein [Roseiflexaceae bacterium]
MDRPLVPPPAMAPDHRQRAGTQLQGRWLLLARGAWLAIAALCLGFFAAGVPAVFAGLQRLNPPAQVDSGQLPPASAHVLQDLGLSLSSYAAYGIALDIVLATVYTAVAALIVWRIAADRFALFVALALLTFGTATYPYPLYALAEAHPAWWPPVAALNFLGSASFGVFLFVFPDGRFV